jgi:hypothetical protein
VLDEKLWSVIRRKVEKQYGILLCFGFCGFCAQENWVLESLKLFLPFCCPQSSSKSVIFSTIPASSYQEEETENILEFGCQKDAFVAAF